MNERAFKNEKHFFFEKAYNENVISIITIAMFEESKGTWQGKTNHKTQI